MIDGTPGPLLRVEGVSKQYGGVRALQDVQFACRAGSIHALLGENGAGKSTFIKILSGVVQPDRGRIFLGGAPASFATPGAAADAGISCIFQELSLLPDLTVADNIGITHPPRRFGLIDKAAQRRRAEQMLARVGGEDIHPAAPVASLPLSRQQLVEIAKALARQPKVLILDEATSALTAADVSKVFTLLKRLRAEGMAIIYISHRMHEIAELADECTVFRNGRYIETFAAGTRSDDAIVEMMIGREYASAFPPLGGTTRDGKPALAVRHLSWAAELKDISLDVHRGEVVGLGGLDGQGQRQFLLALFGVLLGVEGEIEVAGKPVKISSPRDAKSRALGLALIPEDRKNEGLMLPMTVRENLSFAALDAVSRFGRIDRKAEVEMIDAVVRQLAIKSDGLDGPVAALSGGNQQKVVIGKWLMTRPRIVLLNDPTRGIDVGTKQEIYQLLRRLAEQGTAVLFYSTDYDELIGCCDRVAIFYDGTISQMLQGAELTERNLVGAALNLTSAAQ
ncbi:sugar ABC transporter ATP-binding protein [Paraburkholderia humisilvae]|uniref:Arabinose import ATP-binding protein AraG n=1 Tax=Paraburkholderia humisilvae TaxID=627669 RepID=A0A6J5DSA4_9BURK|nr:sugar ABC transporter ATP-binding protein [Paraburkholderia humisilvae]CAB3757129.1 Arabinose import ATP-binding protein AraG [Paraburkholderia humisilvae]